MKKITIYKIVMMLLGNFGLGFGISLFRISNMGTDPFTTMNLGISSFLHMSFGSYQLIINVILTAIAWIYARKHIGIGTIVNMVGIGFIADFFVNSYVNIFDYHLSIAMRIIIILFAVFVITLSFSLYMTSQYGVAPYDAIGLMIEKATNSKIPFAVARVMTDVACVIIGFSFGAVVGISTIITAFFTGPLVQYFNRHLWGPLLQSAENKN
ncbi:YczE/YyaS/YitT family protein [Oceanobacillus neutriphilus]|uniref:Membrane protein YczE n=1 Tax=Oceanobacillus neutriphilus TaxID=531815 RepID=A0ABQ2NSB8_9BACI|nr:membrane protein [Oceanobacillus neutriphilus]GGP08480.1 hypothetical protein GCM10011346_08690 [Oceanobacillus neutriphilus]